MQCAGDHQPGSMTLIDLYMQVARRFGQAMHEHAVRYDLTPMQAMTLAQVGTEPLPTSQIALNLRCDPSNATGLVDQLERRGLVRRTTPASDRRKRLVEATDSGREVWANLQRAMDETRGRLHRLDEAERAELRRLLLVLAADEEPAEAPPAG